MSKREKMVCQRSTTKKKERKDGVPKKHDPEKKKKNGERISQEKESSSTLWTCLSVGKLKHYFSMDPIFDFATEVM